MVAKAHRLELLPPVETRRDLQTLHAQLPLELMEPPVLPKPPRELLALLPLEILRGALTLTALCMC